MDFDTLESIYAHASWANGKLFDTAAQIAEVQLSQAADDSESIFDLLVHLVDVQRTWLARSQQAAVPPLDLAACATLTALRDVWKNVDDANRRYIADLHADDLARSCVTPMPKVSHRPIRAGRFCCIRRSMRPSTAAR